MQPLISSDLPRTIVGNRIDAKLALGLVNQAVQEADARVGRKRLRPPEGLGNETARRRFVDRMSKALGACRLGTVISKNCMRVALGTLSKAEMTDGWEGLAVAQEIWNLDPKHPENFEAGLYHLEGIEMEAFIDKHVMARLAQRRGEKTLDGFLAALSPVWGWCRLANHTRILGVFHVPVAEGTICCERNFMKVDGVAVTEEPVTRITTYLDGRDMNASNLEAWQRLVAAGALEVQPRFPRLSHPTLAETDLLVAMRREGAGWEKRRDFAKKNATVAKDSGPGAPNSSAP